jgi:hypothetical protein
MHPFDIELTTDDGRSFGPAIECRLECEVAAGSVTVTHVWVPAHRRAGRGWQKAGDVDLLDRDSGSDAWRIGLLAKTQAEADPDFVTERLREQRARIGAA